MTSPATIEQAQRLWAAGRPDDALALMDGYLDGRPDDVPVTVAMAEALLARHGNIAAIAWLAQSPALGAPADDARQRFFDLLRSARFVHRGPVSDGDLQFMAVVGRTLAHALENGWADWTIVAGPACDLLAADPGLGLDRELPPFSALSYEAARDVVLGGRLRPFVDNGLLAAMLGNATVTSPMLESTLAQIRRAGLRYAVECADADPMPAELVRFFVALARYAFFSEYLLADSAEEMAAVQAVGADRLAAAASRPDLLLPVVAAYAPLHGFFRDAPEKQVHPAFAALWREQVTEPARERALAETIETFGDIAGAVSLAVKDQYENNPYPRWKARPAPEAARTVADFLRERFPDAPTDRLGADRPADILIAGCGTGQHAIKAAQMYAPSRIVAIDLSRASLAYAKRKSEKLGMTQIRFACGDLLACDALGQEFDLIECVGVLHHLGDPGDGLRRLARLLRPQGAMLLGFYSATARRGITAARAAIAARGFGTDLDAIRRCRSYILSLREDDPIRGVADSPDFYTASGCRDLIMHAQEHVVELSDIRRWLAENGLALLGFEPLPLHHARAYWAMHPDDPLFRNWEYLSRFEAQHPNVFSRMYTLWVQRAAS